MLSVDVLIVGGGPAGSSLGYLLQKSGLKTCIVDKSAFPRKKLCGGLLTKKTYNLISEIYGDANFPCEIETSNVSLFLGFHKLSNINTQSNFYLVERTDFDHYFIKRFSSIGGTLLDNTKIDSFSVSENRAILSNGDEIQYKFLVGADGASSQVRKYVDAAYRPNAMCLEFDSPSTQVGNEIQVYFSAIRSGYGWCFPKRGRFTVGIGGLISKNKDIKASFKNFYENIDKIEGSGNASGALIPFGKFVKKPAKGNILLIGDAAGLVDPITGEGIYFAFLSAKFAYEAITQAIQSIISPENIYLSRIGTIQEIITDANYFNKIIFNNLTKSFFLKLIDGKTNITSYFCENLLSHYNTSYFGFITKYIRVRHERKKNERKKS